MWPKVIVLVLALGSLSETATLQKRSLNSAGQVLQEISSISNYYKDIVLNVSNTKLGTVLSKVDETLDTVLELVPHINTNERDAMRNAVSNLLNLRKRIPIIGTKLSMLASNVERKANKWAGKSQVSPIKRNK